MNETSAITRHYERSSLVEHLRGLSHSTNLLMLSISDQVWAARPATSRKHMAARCEASTSVNRLSMRRTFSQSAQRGARGSSK